MSIKPLTQALHKPRAHQVMTALKAVMLVLVIWGIAYPTLLWALGQLLH